MSSSSSSSSQGEPETWDDWTEEATPARSLFDDSVFPTPELALAHDKQVHGVDLVLLAATLGEQSLTEAKGPANELRPTDFFERIRLINWIRATVSCFLPAPT